MLSSSKASVTRSVFHQAAAQQVDQSQLALVSFIWFLHRHYYETYRCKALTFFKGVIEQDINMHEMVGCVVAVVKISGTCTQSVSQHLNTSSMRNDGSNGSQYGPMVNAWETVL